MDKPDVRILVTGGGTGGHVSPALAVVQTIRSMTELLDRRPVFRYLGSLRGIESEFAPAAGIEFVGVQTGKLRRSRHWWGVISAKNAVDLLRVPVGIVQAAAQVRRFRPHVVLATGGYVAVPPVIAAAMSRVPVLIHEQTVQIGLANRIAARYATRIALTALESAAELPAALRKKAFVTGNPVRSIIFEGDRDRALARLGLTGDAGVPIIYVTGGVLGARVINRAVASVLPELLARTRVVHQCGRQPEGGEQDYDTLMAEAGKLPEPLRHRYIVTPFVGDEIGDVYAVSDIVVGRSGAGTVAEVCALGKPAVLVPLVPTGGDEQTRNAKRLVDVGAAVVIRNADLTGPVLLETLAGLLGDRSRLSAMSEASRSLATPNAAKDIAKALLEIAAYK